jgi:hypothetical protein
LDSWEVLGDVCVDVCGDVCDMDFFSLIVRVMDIQIK